METWWSSGNYLQKSIRGKFDELLQQRRVVKIEFSESCE